MTTVEGPRNTDEALEQNTTVQADDLSLDEEQVKQSSRLSVIRRTVEIHELLMDPEGAGLVTNDEYQSFGPEFRRSEVRAFFGASQRDYSQLIVRGGQVEIGRFHELKSARGEGGSTRLRGSNEDVGWFTAMRLALAGESVESLIHDFRHCRTSSEKALRQTESYSELQLNPFLKTALAKLGRRNLNDDGEILDRARMIAADIADSFGAGQKQKEFVAACLLAYSNLYGSYAKEQKVNLSSPEKTEPKDKELFELTEQIRGKIEKKIAATARPGWLNTTDAEQRLETKMEIARCIESFSREQYLEERRREIEEYAKSHNLTSKTLSN